MPQRLPCLVGALFISALAPALCADVTVALVAGDTSREQLLLATLESDPLSALLQEQKLAATAVATPENALRIRQLASADIIAAIESPETPPAPRGNIQPNSLGIVIYDVCTGIRLAGPHHAAPRWCRRPVGPFNPPHCRL